MTGKPALILLPNVLGEEDSSSRQFPPEVQEKVYILDGLIAESEKGARRFLKRFSFRDGKTFRDIPIRLLNEHTQEKELFSLLEPILQGQIWGLISDAGLPCLADPGAKVVALARKHNIVVEACSGPSSLFFALMLSGLSAQRFCFNGYLQREPQLLKKQIKELEKLSKEQQMTQMFIEAPYRCDSLFQTLVQELDPSTLLCICSNLATESQWVKTLPVRNWKKEEAPSLHKQLVVFLFSSAQN